MALVGGIDLSTLGDQFGGYTPGRVLIVDADGPAYAAAATVKTLGTGLRKFQQFILAQMFMAQAERAELHLTASTSAKAGRFNVIAAKPYQGNREGKAKPPLLEPLRQAIAHESNWLREYTATMHHILEADDGMMIQAYQYGDAGVIWSEDKDLRMTPFNYFCQDTNRIIKVNGFGSIYIKITGSGTKKVLGYGRKFFWAQMLMGDTADNIQGVKTLNGKLCGPVAAYDALWMEEIESKAANIVIDAYRAIGQNPIPEGWLLWMLRADNDTFWTYINELDWTQANRAFLDECVRREWFRVPATKELEFEDVEF